MAGPLSGIAGSQVPLGTTFQPGSTSSSNGTQTNQDSSSVGGRPSADTPSESAPVVSTQETETNTQSFTQQEPDTGVGTEQAVANQNAPRGSIIDQLV